MPAGYQSLLGLVLFQFLISVCDAERLSISGTENRNRLTWKRIATVCMKRDLFITYQIVYNAARGCCPKLLMYSDQQYQKIVFMKSLEIIDRGQDMHDKFVVDKLYEEGSKLMNEVQRRLESTSSCAQVNIQQMKVLDPTQVSRILASRFQREAMCPRSGVSDNLTFFVHSLHCQIAHFNLWDYCAEMLSLFRVDFLVFGEDEMKAKTSSSRKIFQQNSSGLTTNIFIRSTQPS